MANPKPVKFKENGMANRGGWLLQVYMSGDSWHGRIYWCGRKRDEIEIVLACVYHLPTREDAERSLEACWRARREYPLA